MAWSIPNWQGVYGYGTPAKFRTGMFELCRAVNERQTAIGLSLTTFYKADGTQAANISLADLEGMRLTGANTYFKQNTQRIRTAVLTMLPIFTESSGKSDNWNNTTMAADIGYAIPGNPTHVNQTDYWQGMQDIMDRLIYATADNVIDTQTVGSGSGSDPQTSRQAAWDDIGANPGTGFTFWSMANPSGSWVAGQSNNSLANYSYVGYRHTGIIVTIAQMYGAITHEETNYHISAINIASPPSGTIAGVSIDNSHGSHIITTSTASLTANFSHTRTITTALPATVPFSDVGEFIIGASSVEGERVYIWFDIAAELTDQA